MRPRGIITHVPSTAGGEEGIAVSIIPPKKPRYEAGAPVAISVAGGHSAGNVSSRMNVAGCGFVEIGFAFPSGGHGEAKSGGTYDYRGPKCMEALRDVILFAMGKRADIQGRKIQEIVGDIHVLSSNVGLYGGSHGGNACGAAMGLHGQEFPDLAWYVSMESPYGEGAAGVELGGRNGRLCPAYDPETGVLDLSKLAFDPDLELRPFGAGRSRRPSGPALVGSLFFDMDGDGKCESDEDYRVQGLMFDVGGGRKSWYSVRLMRAAEERGLFGDSRPAHIPTLEEAVEFWRYRDATGLVADAVRKVPDVAVIVLANETDHVQIAPDHPHIRAQVNGFQEAGAKLIRLNSDRAYVEWLFDREAPGVPDNDAGLQYTPKTIGAALCPDGAVPKQLLSAVAICELADRVEAGNFEPNLSRVLFPDAPKTAGPPPGAGRRPSGREGLPPRRSPRPGDAGPPDRRPQREGPLARPGIQERTRDAIPQPPSVPAARSTVADKPAAAPRYLLTILNQNYFRDAPDQKMAAETLLRFLAICRRRGVEPELFFTGLSFDMHIEDVPEIMEELKESGRDWHHHGSNRPPKPRPIDLVQGKPWPEAVEAVQQYERYEIIDGKPARLDHSKVGGLKKMVQYFGRPPLATGRFVKAPILEVCKQYGAKMGIGGQDWYKLPSSWFWHMGTLNRPDDVFVHPTWDFNEWTRYCWEIHEGRKPDLEAIQSHPGEPIDLKAKMDARIARLDPDLPAFLVFCFHNNDFFGYRWNVPDRYSPEYREFYMGKCEEFLDWVLKEKKFKPVSLRDAYEMAAARNLKPTAKEAESIARQIVESIDSDGGLPSHVTTSRSGYSLTEAWQLFAATLTGNKLQFPDLLGPTEVRPPTEDIGDFTIDQLRQSAGSVRIEGSVDPTVPVGDSRINAAEFLYLMARAVLGHESAGGKKVEMIQPFVSPGKMGGPLDKLQFWTHKPAYYADTEGRAQNATSTEVNVRGQEMRRSGRIQQVPAGRRPPF